MSEQRVKTQITLSKGADSEGVREWGRGQSNPFDSKN